MLINTTTWLMTEELKKRGYDITYVNEALYYFEYYGRRIYGLSIRTFAQNSVSYSLTKNKYLTKVLLQHFGFPTAKGVKLKNGDSENIEELTFPIVMKPLNLHGGEGVITNIQSFEEVENYFDTYPHFTDIIAEEQLEGDEVRLLVVGGKYFAATRRVPAYVIGNGIATVEVLLKSENAKREAAIDEAKETQGRIPGFYKIPFNETSKKLLEVQKLTLDTVPDAGQHVALQTVANMGMGAKAIDLTDVVCKDIRAFAEQVAFSFGLRTMGMDLMVKDLTKPLKENPKCGVVELNAAPGLGPHAFPDEGIARNPAPIIVEELLQHLKRKKDLYT